MVARIAVHEFRLLLRRRSTWLLAALFLALVVAAAGLNAARQQRERAQQQAYQALVRAQWEGQPDRHPHRVAHYGTFAFKAPGPLAAVDPGVDSYAGRVQYLEAHRQNAANFAEAGALSSVFRFGELSLAFVLQLILPLVVIVLGHRTFAEDRESGRLRVLLAQGAAPRALAYGKALGLAAATLPFLALAAVAAVLVTRIDGGVTADRVARLGLLGLGAGLQLVAWIGLTVWVSARAAQPARALAVLVAFWLGGNVVLPRAAAALAAAVHPLPDKSSFAAAVERETRALGDSHNPNDPLFGALKAETLALYGVTQVEDLPINWGAIVMARGEELSAQTFARHFEALGRRLAAQARVVEGAAVFAPSLAFRQISTAAAGTDLRAQLVFQREAEAYRFAFVQKLNALHRDHVPYRGDRDTRLAASTWGEFADFRPSTPTLSESFLPLLPLWLALLAWAVGPFVALHRLRLSAV